MWNEGLFIMPQHLQLIDRHHEEALDQRFRSVLSHTWGISDLEINTEELARGVFKVNRCTAIMPDGLFIEIGPEEQQKGVVLTTGPLTSNAVDVYLGVPSDTTRGTPHYVGEAGTPGARYLRQTSIISDDYGAQERAEVDCVVPNVQLLLGEDERSNYITMKIAELRVSEEGTLKVSDRYIPPLLRIEANPSLVGQLSLLVNTVSAKQNSLADRYRGRTNAITEFGATDMATFWYLHTVNSWLPTLMHFANSAQVHPETLYLALVSLAGQLTTFEEQIDPQSLPRYRHLDLGETFSSLFTRLNRMLGTVISQDHTEIPLSQSQPGLFLGEPDDPALLRNSELYLVVSGDLPQSVLRDDVLQYIKISSLDQISHIVQAAVPGVEASIELSPPPAIPVRAHHVYLRLQQSGQYWSGILSSNSIAIYQPVEPDKVQLKLLAVER